MREEFDYEQKLGAMLPKIFVLIVAVSALTSVATTLIVLRMTGFL